MTPRHFRPTLLVPMLLLAAACAPAPEAPAQAAPATAAPAADQPPPPPDDLTGTRLEDLLRPEDTLASVQARLGAANAVGETLSGAEGETFGGWLLFPDQPTRRLSVYLDDSGQHPSLLVANATATDWRRADGMRIGLDSNQLAALNGGPFAFMGFDWDYGGVVTDWRGGKLAAEGVGSGPVTLCPPEFGPGEFSDDYPMGDQEFSSDLPVVVANPPTVCEFALTVALPATE